jgi:hypothetical protein
MDTVRCVATNSHLVVSLRVYRAVTEQWMFLVAPEFWLWALMSHNACHVRHHINDKQRPLSCTNTYQAYPYSSILPRPQKIDFCVLVGCYGCTIRPLILLFNLNYTRDLTVFSLLLPMHLPCRGLWRSMCRFTVTNAVHKLSPIPVPLLTFCNIPTWVWGVLFSCLILKLQGHLLSGICNRLSHIAATVHICRSCPSVIRNNGDVGPT